VVEKELRLGGEACMDSDGSCRNNTTSSGTQEGGTKVNVIVRRNPCKVPVRRLCCGMVYFAVGPNHWGPWNCSSTAVRR